MNQGMEKYFQKQQRKKRVRRIAAVLACAVIFCTAYVLILPAITLEKETCDIPEHTHTQSCFTRVTSIPKKIPACNAQTQNLHQHTPGCPGEEDALICGYADYFVHTHDSSCYDETGNFWCPLPEIRTHAHDAGCYAPTETVHTHTDGCYTTEYGELICTLHQHTDSCYAESSILICGQEESAGHQHDDACMDEEGNLICTEEPSEGHRHDTGCYETTRELICGMESDHLHGDACYQQIKTLLCGLPDDAGESEPGEPALVCGKEEILLHTHAPECFDAGGNPICGMTQVLSHQHTDACFETVDTPVDPEALTCPLPEDETHTHTPLCYGMWELTCGMEEHTYSEACQGTSDPAEPAEEPASAPILAEDGALIRELSVEAVTEAAEITPITVHRGATMIYRLCVKTGSYTDTVYAQGRVKLEFVLPLSSEEAEFVLADMPWLDSTEGYAPEIAAETRIIADAEVPCLVLTGYKLLTAQDGESGVIPGEFSEDVTIHVQDMAPGKSAVLQVSAAMEYNTWDGSCETHQTPEKLTVTSEPFTAVCSEEEMQAFHDQFLAQIAELEAAEALDTAAAEALMEELREAFRAGTLSEDHFKELYMRIFTLCYGSPESIAESAVGSNWISLRDSGWFEAYGGYAAGSASMRSARAVSPLRLTASAASSSGSSPQASDVQIRDRGGANSSEDSSVSVSKTIAGTALENVFDITLQVTTSLSISEFIDEPDMAVVIVMDISNTMNGNFGGTTRYAAAMDAAENFLKQFAANNSLGISKVGYVAFNTNAHQIFGLQSCSGESEANALIHTMRTQSGNIINNYAYEDGAIVDHSRFTNVEAGLSMASDMLSGVSNRNKFIIFLSDGFPTTYISSGYSGYDPYDSTGRFYDHVLNKKCLYGTSYSDEAAIRARQRAAAIKASGVTIFSIGVDVGGQTIEKYVTQSENANGFSVVDRTSTTYEIGDASSAESYKNWLRSSIGSGYYYDSTDSAGLTSAFGQILQQIKHEVMEGAQADWVTKDPIPTVENSAERVEFIGFFDTASELAGTSLTGTHTSGGENTAVFLAETNAIRWDLKNSGYQETGSDGVTTYTYRLVYRVRLKNESAGFVESEIYPTNDTTVLQYRTIQSIDGSSTISDPKTIAFPIPSVYGYLAELTFRKQDTAGNLLAGAEFTLRHDTSACPICRGNGTAVSVTDMTAISGGDGIVSFTGIPSGHQYSLLETGVPDGYSVTGDTYHVTVAYDGITVAVTGPGGDNPVWDGTITNQIYYALPDTGGAGTRLYSLGGFLLMISGAVLLAYFHIRGGKEDYTAL